MTFSTDLWDSVVADVVTMTARPDLETTLVPLGVKMATTMCHHVEKFPRDLVLTSVTSATSIYTQAIDVSTSPFDRFRDVGDVKLLDVSGTPLDAPTVDVAEFGDFYVPGYPGQWKPTVAWIAGTNLNIRAVSGFYGVQVAWYQSPAVTRATYLSWIAQNVPHVIAYRAAWFIWNRTGNEQKAKEADDMLRSVLLPDLIAQYGTTAGR